MNDLKTPRYRFRDVVCQAVSDLLRHRRLVFVLCVLTVALAVFILWTSSHFALGIYREADRSVDKTELRRVIAVGSVVRGKAFGPERLGRMAGWPDQPAQYGFFDLPGYYHHLACGFSFADGHSEIHRWRDNRTMPPLQYDGEVNDMFDAPDDQAVAWLQAHATRPNN